MAARPNWELEIGNSELVDERTEVRRQKRENEKERVNFTFKRREYFHTLPSVLCLLPSLGRRVVGNGLDRSASNKNPRGKQSIFAAI